MTMFLAPYTAIADIDGSPLDAGFLFFGEYGKDPELFPVEVFWDADFTVPAAQPIRTRNGYPVRNGSPTKVYLKTAQHSIVIKNRNSAFILVDFNNKGWDASFVVDGDENQHQINKDQKALNNGYESVAEMLAIQNPANGMRVYVKSYHAGLNKGGGWYIFDESQSSNTDDILNINGWLLQHNNPINLHSCGLKGDGVSDDRPALQKAIRVASQAKLNLIGNPSDTYLLNSLSSESGSVCLVWCNTSYVNLDLNGSTIKVANNLGDYQAVFAAGWVHTHFKITNGTIDQNTTNNPPQSPVLWSNTNGQRSIVNAYSVPHKYFEVTSIKMLDVLGVWEINTTQAEVVNICDNELYYSAVPITHTDKTAFYVLPRRSGEIKNNKLFGDTYGNATTAVEIHGSNCEFIGNTVTGFRSPLFISPSNREANSAVVSNIYVTNNDFNACQSGVIIWVESAENLSKPLQNIQITGNKVLIDSRLITNKDMGLLNGTGVGFLGADSDCEIDGLYIKDNKINYLYNAENIGKDSPAAIDLISFMPNSAFKWSNIFIQNNTIENAPCNGIALGNTSASSHTSSISNVLVSGNSVIDCGAALFNANSYAVRVFNPSNMSKIRFTSNTLTETSNSVTYMKFINVDAGDGSAATGVRFYDNETSFHRSTSINEMYVAGGVMINDFRKNHLNNNDTDTKAKYGSTFTDLNTGSTIVQSSLNANTPVWKTITH